MFDSYFASASGSLITTSIGCGQKGKTSQDAPNEPGKNRRSRSQGVCPSNFSQEMFSGDGLRPPIALNPKRAESLSALTSPGGARRLYFINNKTQNHFQGFQVFLYIPTQPVENRRVRQPFRFEPLLPGREDQCVLYLDNQISQGYGSDRAAGTFR